INTLRVASRKNLIEMGPVASSKNLIESDLVASRKNLDELSQILHLENESFHCLEPDSSRVTP
ncbi:MAG: hypothetical protein ACREAC_31585, partial [Blastocatellia bacterium]